MMKVFAASGLLLLILLVWTCSGQQPVLVECTYLNLRVIAKRTLFYPDQLVGPDELFIGTGCQAIHVRPDELEFDYPVALCGTIIQCHVVVVDPSHTVIQACAYQQQGASLSAMLKYTCQKETQRTTFYTWLTYTPRNGSIAAELPLQCVVPSAYVSDDNPHIVAQCPTDQYWFLKRRLYCKNCDCAHFNDNWSTPFYGTRNYSQRPF